MSDTRRPFSYAVVRKILSPQTIGDELPRPGTGFFHTTLSVADHESGYVPVTSPCPDGPRHTGQYFAPSPSTVTIRTSTSCAVVDQPDSPSHPTATPIRTQVRNIYLPSMGSFNARHFVMCPLRNETLKPRRFSTAPAMYARGPCPQ